MSHDGRPNTGPLDLFYLLKRRNISFSQWCKSCGIETKTDFQRVKTNTEALGEYFLPPEMTVLAGSLPDALESPAEPVPAQPPSETPTAIAEASQPQETTVPTKKQKKSVS
jgi:hypothetical protein